MHSSVTVRPAEQKDSQTYFDWLKAASDRNLVDTGVYSYPTCNTVVVEKNNEPVLMNSFHAVIMMEALAPKPGVSPKDEAIALRELYEAIKRIADATGVREIWFVCKDEGLNKFVQKHGFEQVNVAMFKMKLPAPTQEQE